MLLDIYFDIFPEYPEVMSARTGVAGLRQLIS